MVKRSPPEKGQIGCLTLGDDKVKVEVLGAATQQGVQGWRFKKVGSNERLFIKNVGRGVGWVPDIPEARRGAAAGGKRSVLDDPNFNTNTRYTNTNDAKRRKEWSNPTYETTQAQNNSTPPVLSESTGGSKWKPFGKRTFQFPRDNPVFYARGEDTGQMSVPTTAGQIGYIQADDGTKVKLEFCGVTTSTGFGQRSTTYRFKVCDKKNHGKKITKLFGKTTRIGEGFRVKSTDVRKIGWETGTTPAAVGRSGDNSGKNAAKNGNAAASEAAVGRSGDNSGKNGNAAAPEAVAVGRSKGVEDSGKGDNSGKNARGGRQKSGNAAKNGNAAAPAAAVGRSGGSPGTLPYTEAKKEAKITSGTTKLKQVRDPEGTSSTDDDTDQKKPASTEVLEFMAAPFGALVTICGSFLSMAWIGRSYY